MMKNIILHWFVYIFIFAFQKCVLQQKLSLDTIHKEFKVNSGSNFDRIKNGASDESGETIELIEPIDDCYEIYGPMIPIPVRRKAHIKAKHNKLMKKMKEKKLKHSKAPKRSRSNKISQNTTLELSYFRSRTNPLKNEPIKWVHCTEFITPFVKNIKQKKIHPKLMNKDDHEVQRLIHLLRTHTDDFTNEDIYSILLQISQISIRLYYWDITAMKTLLNTIIEGPEHSFKTLKRGLKKIFKEWRLDISNTSSLLVHSKIFRPMCLRDARLDGSTKQPHSKFVTQRSTATEDSCLKYDKDGSCTLRRQNKSN